MTDRFLNAFFVLAMAAFPALAQDATEIIHGVAIADPFRALEDATRPETQAFFRDQDARARAALAAIPGRAALAARIRELSRAGTVVTSLKLEGSRIFYLRRLPGEPTAALCMREGFSGAERVLVDPQKAGQRAAIDWYSPSPDGQHVVYGLSSAGSEDSVLHILSVATGRGMGETIDRTRFNQNLEWDPDSRAFYYARIPEGGQGAKRYANVRVYRHVLGRSPTRDEIVFAAGAGGARDVPEFVYPSIHVPLEGRHAYAIARDGVRNEISVYVSPHRDLAAGRPAWRKFIAFEDQVTAIEGWKGDLYVLSHKGAPNYRLLRLDAAEPVLARARVVAPEGDSVIHSMALARDALYLRTSVGGIDRLERVALGLLGPRKPEFVKTSFDSGISQIATHPRRPGAVLRMQGWTDPPAIVEVDAKTGNLSDTKLQPKSGADFSAMDDVRLYAPAEDGTKIPVTLMYRKGTQLTSDNPTLLIGYGSYGLSMRPTFDPARLAWLERGGIIAIAHIRGGGEYGERWHQAGRKATKINTITDFIAVADFLVKYGFTNPRRLAIQGGSAGGIPAGGALVRRPDLFAAVVARVPVMDMLRVEFAPNGPSNIPEFGSIATREGFEALHVMSAYHHVKDGTPYPAVLLTTGYNDPRVEPWQPGKMAARLQQATSSGKPVLLRVDFEAGHGRGSTRAQLDEELADIYAFLLWQFGDPQFQPLALVRPAESVPLDPATPR
jgi:prolyl oligopeptidase